MSHANTAFSFSDPAEPQVLAAARALAARLAADQAISRVTVNAAMADHFGGSDAEGRWSVRDAHAALELAQVLFLAQATEFSPAMSSSFADEAFTRLECLVPTQSNRSDEQIEWQQFATPPRLAWMAAKACAISAAELVLEPSAGTGMLGVWAAKATARLALNEISPLRRECLGVVFPEATVTGFDGELIDELLTPDVGPSVVLMNPPYSHGIERGHDGRTGDRHLRSAWKRLLPGGRLVAVMPEWFELPKFLAGIAGPLSLRLNATIERGFIKQGTSISTRLLILDKAEDGTSPIIAQPANFAELHLLIDMLPDRVSLPAGPSIGIKPALPLRLVANKTKPVPLKVHPTDAAPSILPLDFTPLEAPAPIESQVGHYLPYRPSRISIADAVPHPTPLVESVAMGSITAPVPEVVPLLDPDVPVMPLDDSLAILSVRDSLTECEAAAAIVQRWLADDATLAASDIGIIVPQGAEYGHYLAETFAHAGLVASSLPGVSQRRNIGGEALLHFLQCRRRPAPAMALASLYCSPVLCWPEEVGTALAAAVMDGDFQPRDVRDFTGRQAALFALIRSNSPSTNGQLKEQIRSFQRLLSDNEALAEDVAEAKQQASRLIAALGNANDAAEAELEKAIQMAAAYQAAPPARGAYFLGGISVMMAHETPKRPFRKLLVLGFNDGAYPSPPAGNPFFLDSEVASIADVTGIQLPSQAQQLAAALELFTRQIGAASEQVILILSERDRSGSSLSVSSSLPLISRLVQGIKDPEDLIVPLSHSEGTIWDRLVAWKPRPLIEPALMPEVPPHYAFDFNLLGLRQKEDGSARAQSPSRLEKLLVSPLAWLLAELGAEHVSWQPEALDVMLRGSLAHEVFERLFVPGKAHPSNEEIETKVPDLLLDRIRALAPFLQTSAWAVERNTLEAEITKSAKHWSLVLKSLDAEIVGNEFWLSGELFGHPVHGKADCLLRLPDGQPIVVDYKKSSSGTRRQRLQKGWDLQVDLYRRMNVRLDERSNEGVVRIAEALSGWSKLPAVAYHTLNDGNVLLNGIDEFDSAEVELVAGDIAEHALALISARFDALKAGRLDTNTTADEKFFQRSAALGTYALEDSPLIPAFMRDDINPSVALTDNEDD